MKLNPFRLFNKDDPVDKLNIRMNITTLTYVTDLDHRQELLDTIDTDSSKTKVKAFHTELDELTREIFGAEADFVGRLRVLLEIHSGAVGRLEMAANQRRQCIRKRKADVNQALQQGYERAKVSCKIKTATNNPKSPT